MSAETEHAIRLANAALIRPGADPDDDLAVLSRQFLLAREKIDALPRSCPRCGFLGEDKKK